MACAALIILITITGGLFVISFLFLVIQLSKWWNWLNAVAYSVSNDIQCDGNCELTYRSLPLPSLKSEFHVPLASFCADLIARVENHYNDLPIPPQTQTTVTKIFEYANEVNGALFIDDNNIAYLAFRGTATDEERRQDLKFKQNQMSQTEFKGIKCHEGFVEVYTSIIDDIKETLQNSTFTSLVICGHSLGAGIATILSLDFQNEYPVYTYVFGSPRVCDTFETKAEAFWRVENTLDIVTMLPLGVMWNTKDHETLAFYSHSGLDARFTTNWKSTTNNHTMPVYIDALDNWE